MTVLLQVSDPHFGTERAHVAAALLTLVRGLQPDIVVLSGDITQRATQRQFTAARAFIDTLQIPQVISIPGNHDIPLFNLLLRTTKPYARYRKAFGQSLESEFENDDVLLLALNTTRWYRHIDGELSTGQIERVAARLQQSPASGWRIVVTHQPLAVKNEEDAHDRVHGFQSAITRWAAAGADVVMGGHIHLPYVLPIHQHFPALARPLWAVQAGTALSRRVREAVPNSVNVLRISGGTYSQRTLLVERWDFSDAGQAFQCVSVDQLHQ